MRICVCVLKVFIIRLSSSSGLPDISYSERVEIVFKLESWWVLLIDVFSEDKRFANISSALTWALSVWWQILDNWASVPLVSRETNISQIFFLIHSSLCISPRYRNKSRIDTLVSVNARCSISSVSMRPYRFARNPRFKLSISWENISESSNVSIIVFLSRWIPWDSNIDISKRTLCPTIIASPIKSCTLFLILSKSGFHINISFEIPVIMVTSCSSCLPGLISILLSSRFFITKSPPSNSILKRIAAISMIVSSMGFSPVVSRSRAINSIVIFLKISPS